MSDGVTVGTNVAMARVGSPGTISNPTARSASSPAMPALGTGAGCQSPGTTSRAGPTFTTRPGGASELAGATTWAAQTPTTAARAPVTITARSVATALGRRSGCRWDRVTRLSSRGV